MVIVGGGFAGVAAAIEFLKSGHKVVLIDKNIVGGSSSGRSAGFLTPDSELELHQLVRRYGVKAAAEIWQAPLRGIERLVASIKKHDIQCGLLKQDSLFLGLGKGGKEAVDSELHCRQEVGFTDQRTYDEQQLKGILGAEGLHAPAFATAARTASIHSRACRDSRTCWSTTACRSTRARRWNGSKITPSTRTAAASLPTRSSSRWTSWMNPSARWRMKFFTPRRS